MVEACLEGEEAQAKAMAAWGAFMEKHATSFSDGGAPVGMSKTVDGSGTHDHGGANPFVGLRLCGSSNN